MYKTDLRNAIVIILEKKGANKCEYYLIKLEFFPCFLGFNKNL